MFGSNVLDIAIGVVFVYLLLSLLCSTINEQIIVRILDLRAKMLENGINTMLADPRSQALAKQFYDSALIQSISQRTTSGKIRKPSYIPANIFACALIHTDIVQAYKAAPDSEHPALPEALALLLRNASFDPVQEQAILEKWFDSTMERVSGWYKRRVQLIILLLGLSIALILNIDTFSLITNLSNNAAERALIVSAAQGYTTAHASNSDLATLEQNIKLYQPVIGWSGLAKDYPSDLLQWISWVILKIIGLLATAFAVSLGAPFWFDLLNKFVSIRSSGNPPPKSTMPASPANPVKQDDPLADALVKGFTLQQQNALNNLTPTETVAVGVNTHVTTLEVKTNEVKKAQE